MTDNLVCKQDIFLLNALPDVMNHKRISRTRALIGYDSNVGDTATEVPSNHIARKILGGFFARLNGPSSPAEIGHQDENTSMIDVRAGPPESPFMRILIKSLSHILMDFLLKIQLQPSKCTDYKSRRQMLVKGRLRMTDFEPAASERLGRFA